MMPEFKVGTGSVMCLGSSLFAITEQSPPWLIFLGIVGGVAIGSVGIFQRMQDHEAERLRKRIDRLETAMEAKDVELADTKEELRQARCPYAEAGHARCENSASPPIHNEGPVS